jgi:hypothetical protein
LTERLSFLQRHSPSPSKKDRAPKWPLCELSIIKATQATPLSNKKSTFALLHSDAGTAAILCNKLDAGFFHGPLNSFSNIVGHGRALSVAPLETLNSWQRAFRRFRQLRLGPAQQRAGSSNLFDRNHQKLLDTFWIIRL